MKTVKFLLLAAVAIVFASCGRSYDDYCKDYEKYMLQTAKYQGEGDLTQMAVAQAKAIKVYEEAQENLSEEDFVKFIAFTQEVSDKYMDAYDGKIDVDMSSDKKEGLLDKAKNMVDDAKDAAEDLTD